MAHEIAHGHGAEATSTGLHHRKVLMWTFLASDCLFFGSLIATYMAYRGRSLAPPHPAEIFDIPYTSVSAFVLLMSSLTMVLALHALQHGRIRNFRIWLTATALLGLVFVGGQAYEFTTFVEEGLTPSVNLFGSTFYTLTGFHGAHVTVGVLWLLSIVVYSFVKPFDPAVHSLDVEIAGLYWHFVDIVWIVIFTVVYLIPTPVPH
ncbi:MAG: cytochrome c oxidase subunit 3 [Chloroflexi bacterium]|nr:cytochrome c oxidase subunit 3 [Chloroflexota bacterium]MBI4505970.1 cytochrome c oxidase subunit 3 [Chloroflexota bacterium]